jgi:hypothetical protein
LLLLEPLQQQLLQQWMLNLLLVGRKRQQTAADATRPLADLPAQLLVAEHVADLAPYEVAHWSPEQAAEPTLRGQLLLAELRLAELRLSKLFQSKLRLSELRLLSISDLLHFIHVQLLDPCCGRRPGCPVVVT